MKIKIKKLFITRIFLVITAFQIYSNANRVDGVAHKSNKFYDLAEKVNEMGFGLPEIPGSWLTPFKNSKEKIRSKGIFIKSMFDTISKLIGLQTYGFNEKCIRNASNIYTRFEPSYKGILSTELEFERKKNFSEIKRMLFERRVRGKSGKLNILMIKIELGGGHKAAIQAMSESILEGLSRDEQKLINIIPIDFFGPDKDHAAKDFNKILETEDAEALVRNLGGKPLLERFYDTIPGILQIQRNIDSEIEKFAQINGLNLDLLLPDIVISAQPFGLHALRRYVTAKYNTQLRIVPTDFYLGDWLQRFEPLHQFEPTVRYDASYDSEYLRNQFEEKGIRAVTFFGYPIRKDISELADNLYSTDQVIQKKAVSEVDKIINELSQDPDIGKNGFKSGDQTALIMMGSKGTGAQRYISYIQSMFRYAKSLKNQQVVHVYVAALKPRPPKLEELLESDAQKNYDKYYDRQQKIYEEVQSKVQLLGQGADSRIRIHLLSFLNAKQVGSLIYHGVTITKAGGSTAAEVAALGGRALFNMRISQVAPWERGNVHFLESLGVAIRMPTETGLESQFVTEGMKDLIRRGRRGRVHTNEFHHIWGATVLRDLKNILRYKQANAES
ncbi:MAG: hypothetical protein AB8G05_25915 [Oligoflexales bacterium]